jgi:hypothetical protein
MTLLQLTCSGAAQAELFEKMHGLEAEVERLRVEEGGRKKEGEEYQTHLEEELAESQAQRAALLEEGASNDARTEVPEHSSCRDSLITGADMTNCAEGWRPGAGVRGLKCSGGWFAKTGDKGGVDGGRGGGDDGGFGRC